jgi:hypothetical protein
MSDRRPGLDPRRLLGLMQQAVARCHLDLAGTVVLTEAASGAYVVTPVLAALAGADRVVALTLPTPHGTVEEVRAQTAELADLAGVPDRIEFASRKSQALVAEADVVTNSGHVRPIDAETVAWMKSTAVVPLMYEAWELRRTDVDVEACRRRGIRVAGTNERHPEVGVFDYLGLLVLKALLQAGHDLIGERVLVISDNAFAPYVVRTLQANGMVVYHVSRSEEVARVDWDVVVISATPPASGGRPVVLDGLRAGFFCQLWGDVDRTRVQGPWCPVHEPKPGHMGLTLPSLGPNPVVKLQAAGLKCAEVMLRDGVGPDADIVQWVLPTPHAPSPL